MRSAVLLLACGVGSAQAEDSAQCTVCTLVMGKLHHAANHTKSELEAPKVLNDEKANKVQRPQTRRWLKMDYGVALRASVEEELKQVCTQHELRATNELRYSCASFVDKHEDALLRAATGGADWTWCAKTLPGCDEVAIKQAVKANATPPAKFSGLTACATANNLAVQFYERGEVHRAALLWRYAIRLHPTYSDAYTNLAVLLQQQQQPHAAWAALRHAVKLTPHSAGLYVRMGSALAMGRPLSSLPPRSTRAMAQLARAAVELQPTESRYWSNLGLTLAALRRPADAAHGLDGNSS